MYMHVLPYRAGVMFGDIILREKSKGGSKLIFVTGSPDLHVASSVAWPNHITTPTSVRLR